MTPRDDFIERYLPYVRKVVRTFRASNPATSHLFSDMIGESHLRLVVAADKFFGDDHGQEKYVKAYLSRSVHSGCIDVIRNSRTITSPRDNDSMPCPSSADSTHEIKKSEKERPGCPLFRVYTNGEEGIDLHSLHVEEESLSSQITRKRVIDWSEFLDTPHAAILQQFIATYASGGKGPSQEDLAIRARLRAKVKWIVRTYILSCLNQSHCPTIFDACTTTCASSTMKQE